MQPSVNLAPEIIDWIFQKVRMDKISQSIVNNLRQWSIGEKKPTFGEIEAISKATHIPLGYFFLKTPPAEDLTLIEYRTIDSLELQNPSRNLLDTIHDMQNVQEWMHDYLIDNGSDKLDFIGSFKDNHDVDQVVADMKKRLNLSKAWFSQSKDAWDSFKKLREAADDIGIVIMLNGVVGSNTHRKLEIEEFRAFTLIDEYAPIIFINSNDSQNAKLFSLVHELAHIWIGVNDLFNDRFNNAPQVSDIETKCNAIAGEFLVPQELFEKKWNEQNSSNIKEKIKTIATYFSCGTTVVARKALINKYIGKKIYNEIATEAVKYYNDLQEKKKNDDSGGDYFNTMATRIDNRFLNTLANSAQEGRTLYTDAFRLTHTSYKTFFQLVEKVRGTRT